ncbi:hypothetical protein GCK72_020196 [Caenorhabditis remanei]|uniref:Acyltransferase 3 domain-containing protein n=1 Tax=Caenorhabditis remanei TaxID=31234 RepID=A0A6A5GGT7_CAERE|nr:hypothetical protein GCK72_020196 [Caenorhabditis remanei]KAF1753639.1 hypothetical protein GCK72_020196 [Caenorhabditis remanei]
MRQDIQSLRGLAIIFVFLYHLYPSVFVNGFLGVDIFFVISGYLMAKNLTKFKLKKLSDFSGFYYRRFKRILPLYFLVVFISVVLVHLFLGDFWWRINWRYSIASLFLVTNQVLIHDSADYFKHFLADEKSPNVFLHLWSLGVEMQFYLIVPFIFFALQILKSDILKLIAVFLTSIIGGIAFSLINAHFAFNFMALRLWQFSAGFCALFWSKVFVKKLPEKVENLKVRAIIEKEDVVTTILSILFLCIFPSGIDKQVLRPLVTFATGALIVAESRDNKLLKSDMLIYMGNISYIVYLVHWPILSIFAIKTNFQCDLLVTLLTLLSSVFLHHLYEKQYLKLSWKYIFPLVFSLIAANAGLQYSVREHTGFWERSYPPELQTIIDNNKGLQDYWVRVPDKNDKCVTTDMKHPDQASRGYEFCEFPRGKGNISIMNIGNSYVKNLNGHIRSQFNYNFSDYRFLSIIAGFGIYSDPLSEYTVELFKEQVKKYKPDVLFITARFSDYIKIPIQTNDTIVQQINENIKYYEKFSKKVYILGSLPLYKLNFINHFLQYAIQKPEDLEQLHLNQKLADEERKYAVERLKMIKCERCKIYDLSPAFLEKGKYLSFDRNTTLTYVDNSIHLTGPGLELCDPIFSKLAQEIMNSF